MQLVRPVLGRLEKADLRTAWFDEATDFTPWLGRSENIRLLGEAIGIELEVLTLEASVGPFRADIVCQDLRADRKVLVENQLEVTDHRHLGQLLTYAGGLDAVLIVWIASRMTNEHRAALDWLNNATRPGFDFFGLEIELWRIGDSAMAPKFNVVVQPNDWKEQVHASIDAAQTETERQHAAFWGGLHEYLKARNSPIRFGRPPASSTDSIGLGRTGYRLIAWHLRDGQSGVYLRIRGPQAESNLRQLQQRHGAAIEQALSTLGSVIWQPRASAGSSSLSLRAEATAADPDEWPSLYGWLQEALETMQRLLTPLVRGLLSDEPVDAAIELVPGELGSTGPTPVSD